MAGPSTLFLDMNHRVRMRAGESSWHICIISRSDGQLNIVNESVKNMAKCNLEEYHHSETEGSIACSLRDPPSWSELRCQRMEQS